VSITKSIDQEVQRHQKTMEVLKDELKRRIRELPDNPRVTRIAHHCIIPVFKDLGNNWSVEHHDFKRQHEILIAAIDAARPDRCLEVLRNAVKDGSIRCGNEHGNTVRLHPDVIKAVCGLLSMDGGKDEGSSERA
jgi:hypothetical protein